MVLRDNLNKMRMNYQKGSLDISDVGSNPIDFFKKWLKEAIESNCDEPNAFVLSTADELNQPHSRIVLLKEITDSGIIFYTNYSSNKSGDITINNKVAVNFCWLGMERQIRFEGLCHKISKQKSQEYFKTRPVGSQVGAIASPQSKSVTRSFLENKFKEVELLSQTQELTCPDNWGGFLIEINKAEFWQGRENRMHDRIVFKMEKKSWQIDRVAP
jgi:pyridoxamine 5'-phosphate oxidase